MSVVLLDITNNSEELIETAARICYDSQPKEGYVTGKLIKRLIASGHFSPLEHAKATFKIDEVSRAMTHQLVRHRLASFTQRSQRYVDEQDFWYVTPTSIIEGGLEHEYQNDMQKIRDLYGKYREFGIKPEDARFFLPNACQTEIIVTANFREWRTIFELRCSTHAQWEIRNCCKEILTILHEKAPNVFDDIYTKVFPPTESYSI